jgi:predicted nucleic acid-binding protein
MIAIDSSVLIDLLADGEHASQAEACLRLALSSGPVVICDAVVSEVTAGLGHGSEVMDAVESMGILYSPTELRSAIRAGEMQRRYNERRSVSTKSKVKKPEMPRRLVPDFLVGAHALLQCKALITRDQGFFRDYFKGLKVIVPQ